MPKRFNLHTTRVTIAGIAVCIVFAQLAWAAEVTTAPQHSPMVFELAIAKGRLTTPNNTIRVKRGDYVELRWSSDREISLHLHGYDIERRVTPQVLVKMAFKAHLSGRFSVSEHGRGDRHGKALLYLEVYP
jgi:hypothetical protein